MAAKRVVKQTVDFLEMAKRCPPSQKSNFQAFKAKSDGYLRKVMAFPEEPPKIDWAYYKNNAANKAVVEQFEKQYTSTKIPYPNDGGALKKVEEEEKLHMDRIRVFIAKSNERIKQYEQDIEAIKNVLRPYEDMTLDEFAWVHPELSPDPLHKPEVWPFIKEWQNDKSDLIFFRRKGWYAKGPDRYYPATPEADQKAPF